MVTATDPLVKSPDFFDVAAFPDATFNSSRFEKSGDGGTLVGTLTIKGVSREVTLQVEDLGQAKDPWGNDRIAFAAKGSIDRREFGLNWNQALETGGVLVGERVDLEIEIQAVRQVEKAA